MDDNQEQRLQALENCIKGLEEKQTAVLYLLMNQSSHLDNCNELSVDPPRGESDMQYKFRERVRVGQEENGQPIFKWVCANTKEEIHEGIAALLGGNVQPVDPEDHSPIWSTYCVEWFETFQRPRVREKTADKEEYLIKKHISPMFPDRRIASITAKDVQDALQTKSHYAKSFVRDIMNLMSKVFDSALDDDYIRKNPMDSNRVTNTGTKKNAERKPLTASEQADIIRHINDLENISDRRLMAFLMFTCMRPCEIYGLRWEDIDFNNNMIYIKRDLVFSRGKGILGEPKTEDSKRRIPLDPSLRAFLEPIQKEGVVVCRTCRGQEGEYYTEQVAKRAWQRIKSTIDVHGMTPYVGRHTFATNMSKAHIPLKTAITLMGHHDERMLMRTYIHTDEEDIENAGLRMSKFISSMSV